MGRVSLAALFLLLPVVCFSQEVPVICYHDISLSPGNSMTTTPTNFEDHLRYLRREGYTAIGMDELTDFLDGKRRIPEKSIVLTFDDGYEGVYSYAYPLLKKYGFKATVFLVVGKVGDKNCKIPHLTWPQVTQMDGSGVLRAEVHCGLIHNFLGRVWDDPQPGDPTRQEIVDDLQWAKETLSLMLGHPVRYLAWPQGNYNSELVDVATTEGYRALLTAEFGVNCHGDDPLRIKRLAMSSRSDTLDSFIHKLHMAENAVASHHGEEAVIVHGK